MSDNGIRARLAYELYDELDEHGYEDDDEKRWQIAYHFADALLSLPGIAFLELPEISQTLSWPKVFSPLELTSWELREFAATLLAAANKADQGLGTWFFTQDEQDLMGLKPGDRFGPGVVGTPSDRVIDHG